MKKWALTLIALLAMSAWAADVAGTWKASIESPNGNMEITYVFKVDGNKLTGTISSQMGETPISEGKVDGDTLSFVTVREVNGQQFKMNYKGKVTGNEMKLTMSMQFQGEERTFDVTAKKVS